jgi:hypothetical protein
VHLLLVLLVPDLVVIFFGEEALVCYWFSSILFLLHVLLYY